MQAFVFLHWQECHADAVGAGGREFEAQVTALAQKELMWDLEENAGAVSGFGVAATGSAMGQVEQDLNSLVYDVVTFVAANISYEADAAGVMLLRRVVQTLGGWGCVRVLGTGSHHIVCNMASIPSYASYAS